MAETLKPAQDMKADTTRMNTMADSPQPNRTTRNSPNRRGNTVYEAKHRDDSKEIEAAANLERGRWQQGTVVGDPEEPTLRIATYKVQGVRAIIVFVEELLKENCMPARTLALGIPKTGY